MAIPAAPGAPLAPELLKASILRTYIQVKWPRFTSNDAVAVVHELQPEPGEDVKRLAKRLRPLLERRSVRAKHAACLEAAARIQGHPSWHEADYDVPAPRLKLVVLSGSGDATDIYAGKEESFSRWLDALPRMAHWCDERHRLTGAKTFQVHIGGDFVMVGTPVRRREENPNDLTPDPLFIVKPQVSAANWLEGAPAAFEGLRRHLEECGKAALDGVAVSQLLHKYAHRGVTTASFLDSDLTADAPNTELVLLREDNELSPHDGWEIARGDELTCWAQLELAIKDHEENSQVILDGESWRVGRGRYVWELHTIRPKEYVPGLNMRRLNEQDAERLLRRYKVVKNIFAGKVRHHEVNKRVEYLGGPKDTYRVDVHRLLLAANKAGHTWDSLCEALGAEEQMRPELPVGFIMSAAQLLSSKDPNQFFARPNTSEMARGEDDLVLRTLLPRVDTVRYRLGNVPDDLKQTVRDAVTDLIDCLRVRKMRQGGMFAGDSELPQLVHAHDGEELRMKLQDHGLALYASVLPHFFPMDDLPATISRENLAPFAFGHALYLHIEPEA